MKIVQIILGPDNYTWQGKLIALGDDGKLYVEGIKRDVDDAPIGRIWEEFQIAPPIVREQ